MHWIIKEQPDGTLLKSLSQQIQTESASKPESALISILIQRGFRTVEHVKNYFLPKLQGLYPPTQMLGMASAVHRILQAQEKQEKILVYGDYDVDGTTSVTLIHLFFKFYGINHTIYIPDRYEEGYGLSEKGVQYAIDQQFALVICLDCGTKSITLAQKLADHQVDFIVCDHHLPGETLPICVALLNPKQKDCPYPFKELSGCGIGFKLIQALAPLLNAKLNQDFDPFSLIDLVVLSIACDLVPLVDENRILAYHGLKKINSQPLAGIQAIMDLKRETKNKEMNWRISDLVFFIGPRINAAGRLNHAADAVEVLAGENIDLLTPLANELDKTNTDRKLIEDEITQQAEELYYNTDGVHKPAIFLYQESWKKGVIGIVASRMVEKFYKPTILLTQSDGVWVGSGRSVHEFDLHEAISACSEYVSQFGGHKYAAGLTIQPENLNSFEKAFQDFCQKNILESQKVPILEIDEELALAKVSERFLHTLDRMEPFGPDNLRPKFLAKYVKLEHFEWIRDKILRLTFTESNYSGEIQAISFSLYRDQVDLIVNQYYDIVYVPEFNYFNGKRNIQFELKDIRLSL